MYFNIGGNIMFKSLNIAHRGFSGKYPENTMLAFKKAVEAGCDGIEIDVQLTKDGVAIICHDEKIDRTTNGTGFIKDYTYKQLLGFDAGIKYGKEFKCLTIPTLDEFLNYVKDKNLYIDIELKTGVILYDGIEEIVIKKINDYGIKDKTILSSFNHYSMVKCKAIDSTVKTGLLYAAGLYEPQRYARYVGADALHPLFYSVLNEQVVRNIKNANLLINTYTVNEETYMQKLMRLGVDGIITNYPDRLRKVLKGI